MKLANLRQIIIDALEDLKALDLRVLDVSALTTVTDIMVFCSGTSNRHVKSLAENVVKKAKEEKVGVIGIEGEREGDWVLVDLGDAVVHVMLPKVREYYQLDKLWDIKAEEKTEGAKDHSPS